MANISLNEQFGLSCLFRTEWASRLNNPTHEIMVDTRSYSDLEALKSVFKGMQLVYTFKHNGVIFHYQYVGMDGQCFVDLNVDSFGENSTSMTVRYESGYATTITGVNKLIEDFMARTQPLETSGRVFMLTSTNSGLKFSPLPAVVNSPLVRENYSNEVLTTFERISKDLDRPTPTGRIAILDGPPGTGKTHDGFCH